MDKVTLNDRYQYPFISSDGSMSMISEAVDDISVWVYPGVKFPLNVTAEISNGYLQINITDDMFTYSATAVENSGYLKDPSGSVVGTILWNRPGLAALIANIRANDPQPYTSMYVHPSACSIYQKPRLSVIRINGKPVDGGVVNIGVDGGSGVFTKELSDTCRQIHLYGTSIYTSRTPIDTIVFKSKQDKNLDVVIDNISGHVWLYPDPVCDIRVITGDDVLITEVSNDKVY